MNPRRTRSNGVWSVLLAIALSGLALGTVARAQDAAAEQGERGGPPAHAKGGKDERAVPRQTWKSLRKSARTGQSINAVGTPDVGRASMVINGAGTVAYTKNFVGTNATCDADLRDSPEWQPTTAYALHDHVFRLTGSTGDHFMAMNAGTSGAVEPVWPAAFGGTVVDGTITWVNVGQTWVTGRAFTVGMTVRPAIVSVFQLGFNFQATTSGTSGATEPVWPTTAGTTVNDNGIIWKAIGFYPGEFKGCAAMQIISRASGGAETIIASEGDAVGANGTQLMGWTEFIAMNASGKAAFRAETAGFIRNDDESSSGIFTAGPGAGALALVSANGDTIGGRGVCGHSAMVSMNDAGQLVFDALGRQHLATWAPTTAFTSGTRVYPTVANGFRFTANNNGTSGAVEPVWPTSPGRTVVDGTITWTGSVQGCDENDHGLVRFTTGPGNELLVGQGSSVGGSTVIGFGSDNDSQVVGNCTGCKYQNFDGFVSSSGHVSVVLNLADGTQGVFNFTGPGVSTQVARTGGTLTAIGPRVSFNDSDQVVYRGTSGGVDHIFRFTPPATTVTVVSVGDVINGHTVSSLGAFTNVNNSGNVVYGARFAGDTLDGFYYWDGTSTEIVTGTVTAGTPPLDSLASEMVTLNNSNIVAYVTGTNSHPDEADGGAEGHETGGVFLWTKAGGSTKAIAVNDIIGGKTVTAVYAQHTSFARRQLSSAGCVATAYMVGGDDPEMDCREGDPSSGCNSNGGPLLFVSCAAVCPVITLSPPTLPGGSQGTPYSQQLTAVGGAAPYTFTLTTGTLPTGITLTPAGLLAGTPTVSGSFPITITATDINACTGSQAYTLVIGSPTQVTIVIIPSSRTIVVGTSSTLSVRINIPQATNTIVTLTSSNPAIASVPPTVTILANQTSANFSVTGVSVGGPVTITAALPPSFNAVPATATINVVLQIANVPTLNVWGLAILAAALAGAAVLLLRK
jgi:hypothetical protein